MARVTVSSDCESKEEFEVAVSDDLSAFDKWFQSLGNQPIIHSEKAILKTYLYFKRYVEEEA